MVMKRRTFWRAGLAFYVGSLAACRGDDTPTTTATPTPTAGSSAATNATTTMRPEETATVATSPTALASSSAPTATLSAVTPVAASPRVAASPSVGGAAGTPPPPRCALTPSLNGVGASQIGTPPVRSSVGQGHVLSGTVRSLRGCVPLADATLIFWLAGPDGQYAPAYEATVPTDANGTYRFESTYPGTYGGTSPHIHIFISAAGHYGIESVYLPPPGTQSGTYDIVLAPQ